MSILNTKPRWCPAAVATNQGWVNPVSKEVLVSFRNLKDKLDAELADSAPVVAEPELKAEVAQAVPEVVKEVKIKRPRKGQQIIGETVEFNVSSVIGE